MREADGATVYDEYTVNASTPQCGCFLSPAGRNLWAIIIAFPSEKFLVNQ
jgi:hypothetical protein